ncbi:hypothetical protein [Sphingomonas sp.]|uniref:hypothetical protein n=1 Tax=Sphingomonas sp. TaxID=28214 RepID=UPI000DB2D6A3|nr:hypothetical protein [Sphingomonas sp.]PZU10043.1 MAG: hypothetical protein DI605_05430 [Sphingomonas sp.]
MSLFNALRGIGGEYEIQRLLGALGTVVYIVMAPALVWFRMVTVTFDTFCIAYPAGLAACIGASAGAIVLKDRGVAKAKVIEQGTPQ